MVPLFPHLPLGSRFCEPCAGDGALVRHLEGEGHRCVAAWDIEPRGPNIDRHDATDRLIGGNVDFFITNPPWDRELLHKLIVHLSDQHPTWLLMDADWIHTKQSIPYVPRLEKIVSVGRVKWIPGTTMTGKDNCAWHLFTATQGAFALFYGRGP